MLSRLLVLANAALLPFANGARHGLHKAAELGEIAPLKVAISGRRDEYNDRWVKPNLDAQNSKGHVPLHQAICNRKGETKGVKLLLEAGADANVVDGKDQTPLHVVASMCSHKEEFALQSFERIATKFAKLLIKHGAGLQVTSTAERLTPLHVAAAGGHVKLIELLMAKGAVVDAVDAAGATALHHAVRASSERVVLVLIRAGADPSAVDSSGKAARDLATGGNSFSVKIRQHLDDAANIRAAELERVAAKRTAKAQASAAAAGGQEKAAGVEEKSEL